MVMRENELGKAECLVLLCEGNADPRWQKPFIQLCLKIREETPDKTVRLAFLSHTEPSLLTTAHEAAAGGYNKMVVLPMLLSLDEIQEQEIPRQIVETRLAIPALEIVLLPPLGEYPQMTAAIHAVVQSAGQRVTGETTPVQPHRFVLLSTAVEKRKADT